MSISRIRPSGVERRAAFQADRILDAAAELDMRMVGLARAVADPDHVAGGRVPVAAGGIDARHRLLEAEQQRLVAGEEIRLPQLRVRFRVDADGAHEAQRLGDLVGQRLVALALRAVGDEAEHPLMHVLEVGVAARREGAEQVQRRRRLPVGHLLPRRIGRARLLGEGDVVDDVAAIARQLDVALPLRRRGARLGELAGDAADLHHRRGRRRRSAPPPSAGRRGRSRGCCRRRARRSSRRNRRPGAGKPCRARRRQAWPSACAPRLQKPAADRWRAAPRRRRAPRGRDRPAPARSACSRQLAGVHFSLITELQPKPRPILRNRPGSGAVYTPLPCPCQQFATGGARHGSSVRPCVRPVAPAAAVMDARRRSPSRAVEDQEHQPAADAQSSR